MRRSARTVVASAALVLALAAPEMPSRAFSMNEPEVRAALRSPPRSAPARNPERTLDRPVGFAIGTWTRAARRFGLPFPPDLREVRRLGATHVSLPITLGIETVSASDVHRTDDTISDVDLVLLVREARRAGLGVLFVPMLEVERGSRSDWRGRLRPDDPEAFWSAYGAAILHYAILAEGLGVDGFSIAHELTRLYTADGARALEQLSRRVRRVFRGTLIATLNFAPLDVVVPSAAVDVLGVSAYFGLTTSLDASPSELRAAWRDAAERLRVLALTTGRPLMLTEVGYASTDGTSMRPWDHGLGGNVDLEEQRAAYAAAVDELLESSFIEGAFFWIWFGPGGARDRHYTPRGKPAEAEAARLFRGVARSGRNAMRPRSKDGG